MDDETLFARVERGDVEAFTVGYKKYHKLLYVLAYRYLMNKTRCQSEELSGDDDEEPYS